MPQLHETLMGRKLIEHTLPELVSQIRRVADNLEQPIIEAKGCPSSKADLQGQFDELVEFLEYEEGYTSDRETAKRIRLKLEQLGIWHTQQSQMSL